MNSTKLQLPKPITLELSENELRHIKNMSTEIFNCPNRSRGRDLSTIYNSVFKGVILEYALVRQGGVKNDAEFDVRNPSSYGYDVHWNGLKVDVKTIADPSKSKYKVKWVTFNKKHVDTFINVVKKHPKVVDTILFGYYNMISENTYDVKWQLIAPADTFPSNIKQCNDYPNNYDNGVLKYFYNHHKEQRATFNG